MSSKDKLFSTPSNGKLSARIHRSLTLLAEDKDLIRTETLNDRKFTVAPVVPLVEGVHNGEFISFEEIAVFPDSWAGRPLPINHPADDDGDPVTASDPKVLEESVVGMLLNVVVDKKLRGIRGELWIDNDKAEMVAGGQESIDRLVAGEQLEVSTAYFTFFDEIPGMWISPNGDEIPYIGSQISVRPDHLALLPFDVGACSWGDGCGAPRVNVTKETPIKDSDKNKIDDQVVHLNTGEEDLPKELVTMDKKQANSGLRLNGKQLGNSLRAALSAHLPEDEEDIATVKIINRLAVAANIQVSQVVGLINGEIDFAPLSWLRIFAAVLDIDQWDLMGSASGDNFDVRFASNDGGDDSEGKQATGEDSVKTLNANGKCGCQTTNSKEDKEVSTPDDDIAVNKWSLKEAVITTLSALGLRKQEENNMTKEERVEALISNEATPFSEDNREVLESMSDEQIELLEIPAVETDTDGSEQDSGEAASSDKEGVTETASSDPDNSKAAAATAVLTRQSLLDVLGIKSEDLDTLAANADSVKAAKDTKISQLAENADCPYTVEMLNEMSPAMLETTIVQFTENDSASFRIGILGRNSEDAESQIPVAPSIIGGGPQTGGN